MIWTVEPLAAATVPVEGSAAEFPVHRIYCVGQNYAEHVAEMGAPPGEPPLFFAKPSDAVCATGTVPWPSMTENLHHEVELVVAMAEGGSDLSPEQALAKIFGYAVGVDLTRRDLQAAAKERRAPWTLAKGFDHSAPISPIRPVTGSAHPEAADISLAVNGLIRQQGNTRQMIWPVPVLLAELSRYFELKPGDLIFTGTPAGVGPLQPGDTVGCKVEGVGTLAFSMGQKAPPRE